MADHRAAIELAAIEAAEPAPALVTWHRLWLQAHGRSSPPTDQVRHGLAAFRARLDAIGHLAAGPAANLAGAGNVPGPTELMGQIVERAVGPATGEVVVALVATGRPELRIERSRPGWCLTGAAVVLAPPGQVVQGAARLAAFAIDEGDNEVLVLVPLDAPGVRVDSAERPPGVGREVVFSGVELTDAEVVTGVHEYAVLRDQVAVYILGGAFDAAVSLAPAGRWVDELALAQASLHAATRAAGRPQLTWRSTAVSAAVTQVLPLCETIAAAGDSGSSRANEVRDAAAYLCLPWHLTRLAALL